MKTIELVNWKLNGYYPYVPLLGKGVELGNELRGLLQPMDVRVPCGVHTALVQNGYLKDPYFECNSNDCEWVENRWWFFTTEVEIRERPQYPLILEFDGLDYRCRVFLNGKPLGICENMYIKYRFDVTNEIRMGKNSIGVLFENVPQEMAQIGRTEETFTQKARFGYKWDFCTRLVNIGIWQPCRLRERPPHEVEEFYFCPKGGGEAELSLKLAESVRKCPLRVVLSREGKTVFEKSCEITGRKLRIPVFVGHAELWYPNGSGKQPLYELRMITGEGGGQTEKTALVGFKTIELQKNDGATEDSLPYVFAVNGKRIYIKGVNMTPLSHCYGDVTKEQYEELLCALRDMNVNLIRVWGGGLIETEWFYELCDRYGFMVWQEFIQSSSGLNNVPSKRPEFLEKLFETAESATREKRNHVSLCAWSGGNELCDGEGRPSTFEDENLAGLLKIVQKNCPHVPMFPTSASGPQEMANPDTPGKNHDVHGPWQYVGERDHYDFYNRMDSYLHSEFGVAGMTCYESLRRFISEENITLQTVDESLIYRHHGDWWDTTERDTKIFGEPKDIFEKIRQSQFLQAEGLRYAIEANRRRAFQSGGSIIWQANEPFPNFSCTSLIDYYGYKKPAYDSVGKAFSPLNVSLKYEKLVWEAGESFFAELYVTSDHPRSEIRWEVEFAGDVAKKSLRGSIIAGDGKTEKAADISFPVPVGKQMKFILKGVQGERKFENTVVLLIRGENGFAAL